MSLRFALLLLAAGCVRNPGYCALDEDCGAGLTCDRIAHRCLGPEDAGVDMGADIAEPLCPCSGPTPFCADMGCVGCRNDADCSDPDKAFCDPTTASCRACRKHSECSGSHVCLRDHTRPVEGRCADESQVLYVRERQPEPSPGCNDVDTGTQINPMCTLGGAMVALAVPTETRTIVAVAAGTYVRPNAIRRNQLTIVGADEGQTVITAPSNADVFSFQAPSSGKSTVVVQNITAQGGQFGFLCGDSDVSMELFQCRAFDDFIGIDGQACGRMVVDRCEIIDNDGGGLRIGENAPFLVMNNFIFKNGHAPLLSDRIIGGVRIDAVMAANAADSAFVNNTVAYNRTSGKKAGVYCEDSTNFTIFNTVLYDNRDFDSLVIQDTDCAAHYSATDSSTPLSGMMNVTAITSNAFVSPPTDFHLSSAATQLIGAGLTNGALFSNITIPDHDFDGDPRLSPPPPTVDIGADQR